MDKEKDFLNTCFNTVASLKVTNESQEIAKEVVLNEVKRLEKENKILKENAENNDKVVDKVNWENMLLKKENQKLKEQSKPNYYEKGLEDTLKEYQQEMNKIANQQKEFIKYLEDKINTIEPKGTGINYCCEYDSEEDYVNAMQEMKKLDTLKEILQKYKEIIGEDNENNN